MLFKSEDEIDIILFCKTEHFFCAARYYFQRHIGKYIVKCAVIIPKEPMTQRVSHCYVNITFDFVFFALCGFNHILTQVKYFMC